MIDKCVAYNLLVTIASIIQLKSSWKKNYLIRKFNEDTWMRSVEHHYILFIKKFAFKFLFDEFG